MRKRLFCYFGLLLLLLPLLCACQIVPPLNEGIPAPIFDEALDTARNDNTSEQVDIITETNTTQETNLNTVSEPIAESDMESNPLLSQKTSTTAEQYPPSFALPINQPHAYDYGEQIFAPTATLNEIVATFGPCDEFAIYYFSSQNIMSMFFYCQQAYVRFVLTEPEQFSFFAQYDASFNWSLLNPELTGADRDIPFIISSISWSDPTILGPRGVKIGDTFIEVKAKFRDCSVNYDSIPRVTYTTSDVTADINAEDQYEAHGLTCSGVAGDLYPKSPATDYALYYERSGGAPYAGIKTLTSEYVYFYFYEGILVEIYTGNDLLLNMV